MGGGRKKKRGGGQEHRGQKAPKSKPEATVVESDPVDELTEELGDIEVDEGVSPQATLLETAEEEVRKKGGCGHNGLPRIELRKTQLYSNLPKSAKHCVVSLIENRGLVKCQSRIV